MTFEQGELIVYEDDDGRATVDVRLQGESVWLTQSLLAELFQTSIPNISMHIRNIYDEGELQSEATVKKFLTVRREGERDVRRELDYYNLDMIISVGYRVKSSLATQFRIWATSVLNNHLVKGYTLNQKRLAEKGLGEAQQMLALLSNTLASHNLVCEEGISILNIVSKYSRTWQLLWQYDEGSLDLPKKERKDGIVLELGMARGAIGSLRQNLLIKKEATDIFGNERNEGLAGIIGAVQQTFGGQDLYSSIEEKAANLLYFIIKDHPFTDGNKRIGSFLFILFLQVNGLLEKKTFDNKALVALTLLIAASSPDQKGMLIRLVVNLLTEE